MATINLDKDEFGDIALIWLFDQIMNPEQTNSENLKAFIEQHGSKIKPALMKNYLQTDQFQRMQYKRIKGVFDGSDKSIQQIRIGPSEEELRKEKKKDGLVKKAVKTVIKKLMKKESITNADIKILKEIDLQPWED
jgi:hypothetical protein